MDIQKDINIYRKYYLLQLSLLENNVFLYHCNIAVEPSKTNLMMRVKNVSGTTDRSCRCGSWIEHWRNFNNGQIATICRAKGCSRKDLVGAHIKKYYSTDNSEYIVPFCNYHNRQEGIIELVDGTVLAPANKNRTCN